MGADFFRRQSVTGHVVCEKIDELVDAVVGELAIGVTPFAVVFVDAAVGLSAHRSILQRHAAALTDELLRAAEQGIDRDIVEFGKYF